jgi:uncharacterized protein (DUF302 family)
MKTKFGFGKKVGYAFDQAIAKVTSELANEGFGVLSDIDVAATMKKSWVRRCHLPGFSALATQSSRAGHTAVPDIGLFIPCNVLVREDSAGEVEVSFMDPASVLGLVDRADIVPLAKVVKGKLERVLAAL